LASSVLGAGCLSLVPQAALAQGQFPEKPIRFVVPQAPGSATDVIARMLANEASVILKQNIIIENRPGAAFTIGLNAVAKAPPDGYTIGMGMIGALALSPNLLPTLPYNIERDFQPVALISRGHLLLAVSPKSSFRSVKDLIAEAKKSPGKLSNASSANGSPGHVSGELFKFMTGTEIVHVPYRGGAAATTDLIAGRVDFMFESLNSIAPHAKSGAVRALAVSGARRSPAFPDVPTVAEAGVAGYDAPTWTGVIAPANIPPAVLARLNDAINKAIRTPAFIERFGKIGDEPAGGPPEEFAAMIRKESGKWAEVIKRAGIKIK
jgi:tripartite-type tricarboxylate transporter receptor subunit TctC